MRQFSGVKSVGSVLEVAKKNEVEAFHPDWEQHGQGLFP